MPTASSQSSPEGCRPYPGRRFSWRRLPYHVQHPGVTTPASMPAEPAPRSDPAHVAVVDRLRPGAPAPASSECSHLSHNLVEECPGCPVAAVLRKGDLQSCNPGQTDSRRKYQRDRHKLPFWG
jgi:hypothetical protein